jgi:methyl-accepting chemotaxis protein
MALVKTSKIAGAKLAGPAAPAPERPAVAKAAPASKPNAPGRRDKVSERVAAATEELASGLNEAAAAAEELRRSMEQIASGAEEAAGGSQEQLAAIKSVRTNLTAARVQAETSRRRTEAVQVVLVETTVQITASVRAIERNAERQTASVRIIADLETRAQDIGEITRAVSRISDQTSLLALNAAIEAARAGDHGRGFAVVAEEVRALAEGSERSAHDVQGLADSIGADIRSVADAITAAGEAAKTEARAGLAVVDTLDTIRTDMVRLAEGSDDILNASMEAERAVSEAQRGAEQVAAAAEEQSAASTEAQTAIQQQATALDQGQTAARSLAKLADELRTGRAGTSAPEQIGAMAEELSATIQELSGASTEIMAAVEQLNRSSQLQAAATQQTSAALGQIETSANLAQRNAARAGDAVKTMETALLASRTAVERLVTGVGKALVGVQTSLATLVRLETLGRRIEKIIDAVGLGIVQTTMLAVSGSVEAARAGDAGRGFAVVSSDIRSLAREASTSVETIKDTVRDILDQIASLRRDLEQVIAAAELEIQTNRALIVALEKLDGDVAAMSEASAVILAGAEAILSAAGQTAAGARQIAAAAEEASSAARQAATAATQQARGAEDLAAAIEEIASLADDLQRQNG